MGSGGGNLLVGRGQGVQAVGAHSRGRGRGAGGRGTGRGRAAPAGLGQGKDRSQEEKYQKTKNDSCNGVDCSGIKTMYFETLSQMLTATVLIARKAKLSSIVNWPK